MEIEIRIFAEAKPVFRYVGEHHGASRLAHTEDLDWTTLGSDCPPVGVMLVGHAAFIERHHGKRRGRGYLPHAGEWCEPTLRRQPVDQILTLREPFWFKRYCSL